MSIRTSEEDRIVYVYEKEGQISLWIKACIWHVWMPKTPEFYVKLMKRMVPKLKGQHGEGPCFWGMHEEPPEKHGYRLVGELK